MKRDHAASSVVGSGDSAEPSRERVHSSRVQLRVSTAAIAIGLVGVACASKAPVAPVAAPATVSDKCPDLAKGDELAAFDFAKEYVLSREAADKLKAAALAASELGVLADKLDAEFGISCAQIATTLGNRGDWRSGTDACAAAIKSLADAKAKLGPKANVQLIGRQPVCLVEAALMTKCASICDSSAPAPKAKSDCEKSAGHCDGNCEGLCEPKNPGKCDGACEGTCEGTIVGQCGGKCRGKCDGKPSTGTCLGTCTGVCERGPMSGECKGTCTGGCTTPKPAICDNVCVGKCSVELGEARCASPLKTPEVSSDCRARCELESMNKTECSSPQVGLVVTGARDRETPEALKSAVDKAFPGLLKVLGEAGPDASQRVLNAQAVVEAARTGLREMARSGGAATASASEAQLARCFDEPFKRATTLATGIKGALDQASGVRGEIIK